MLQNSAARCHGRWISLSSVFFLLWHASFEAGVNGGVPPESANRLCNHALAPVVFVFPAAVAL